MKKFNLKKTLLHISFIPFISAVLLAVKDAIVGIHYSHLDSSVYGFEAFITSLLSFWDNILFLNLIAWVIIISVIYQVYYLGISLKDAYTFRGKSIDFKKTLFYISASTWAFYFLMGVYALFFGYSFSFLFSTTFYKGIEAMGMSLMVNGLIFSFIPVLPISMVYLVTCWRRKKKSKV